MDTITKVVRKGSVGGGSAPVLIVGCCEGEGEGDMLVVELGVGVTIGAEISTCRISG